MSAEVIGPNVRRLRLSKKLTQAKVAEGAGISIPAFRKIENGKSIPRADTLQAIADALEVKIMELVAPIRVLSRVRFRANKQMTAREQILSDVAGWMERYNELEDILDEKVTYKFSNLVNKIRRKKAENHDPITIASEARKILGLDRDGREETIRDICGLLESAGIKIYKYKFTNDSFFGLSVSSEDGGPAIIVNINPRFPVERWIFSAAHELGHLLMHLNDFNVEQKSEGKLQEKEANLFAAHFLMPKELFLKEWDNSKGLDFFNRVNKVKRIFRVSYGTIILRLGEHGKDIAMLYKKFRAQYLKKFGRQLERTTEPNGISKEDFLLKRTIEPSGISNEDFLPDRLAGLVRTAITLKMISMSRAAEILQLNLSEMRELAKFWVEDERDAKGVSSN